MFFVLDVNQCCLLSLAIKLVAKAWLPEVRKFQLVAVILSDIGKDKGSLHREGETITLE